MFLQLKTRRLDLDAPKVMGIINVTPDSFSDGGRHQSVDAVVDHARCLVDAGAAILDVGGESTRPGAARVDEQAELDRVIPVIEALSSRFDVAVSVDTSKPAVMVAAGQAGAEMVNDVRALQVPGALDAVAKAGMAACLMHMQGEPQTMQAAPSYGRPIVDEIFDFLAQRLQRALAAGIALDRIALDPGIGLARRWRTIWRCWRPRSGSRHWGALSCWAFRANPCSGNYWAWPWTRAILPAR